MLKQTKFKELKWFFNNNFYETSSKKEGKDEWTLYEEDN